MSDVLFEAQTILFAGPDAVIQAAQRDNARAFTRIPRNRKGYPNDDVVEAEDRALAERIGFVYGEIEDEKFIKVTAPAGWGIVPTDHSMYSDYVDEQGRKRGSQFFKGVFYDYEAFYHFLTRYHIDIIKPEDWFARLYPKRLTTTEKRRVLVRDDEVTERQDRFDDGYYSPRGFGRFIERGPRYEQRDVEVELPEDQQPQPIGFNQHVAVIDRVTGKQIWKGKAYYHPAREEDRETYLKSEEKDQAERTKALAWLEKRFPEWRDPAAYW